MRRADIEVPNLAVDMNSWARSACYPRSTFYPLSDGPSTRNHRITRSCFRTCSTCRSRRQAGFCPYTRRTISNRAEQTFERLRYFLGGDRPSQTAHLALYPTRITGQVSNSSTVRVVSQGWLHRLQSFALRLTPLLNLPAPVRRQTLYLLLRVGRVLCF